MSINETCPVTVDLHEFDLSRTPFNRLPEDLIKVIGNKLEILLRKDWEWEEIDRLLLLAPAATRYVVDRDAPFLSVRMSRISIQSAVNRGQYKKCNIYEGWPTQWPTLSERLALERVDAQRKLNF
jgi:hypothetical protein